MTEPKSVEIKLGGETFVVKLPLTLKQLRNFQPAIVKYKGNLKTPEDFDEAFNAILAVMDTKVYPKMCRAYLDELRATPEEIFEILDTLSFESGVFKKKEPKEGEGAGEESGEATGKASL